MFGCWGIAKDESTIRIDLDNELEGASSSPSSSPRPLLVLSLRRLSLKLSLALAPTADARFFTREQVLAVINSSKPLQMTREQVSRLDGKEGEAGATQDGKAGQQGDFLMPPACVPLLLDPPFLSPPLGPFSLEKLLTSLLAQHGHRQHARHGLGERHALQPGPGLDGHAGSQDVALDL